MRDSRKHIHIPLPVASNEVVQNLRGALENLGKFAKVNASEPVPHIGHLELKEGQIICHDRVSGKSIIGLARCFVTALLSDSVRHEHEKQRDLLQDELLKAIEIVKNSYPLISRLKEGDESQQKLADTALSTIEHYNEVMKGSQETAPSLSQRFARFLFQHSGLSLDKLAGKTIELPMPASLQCRSHRDKDSMYRVQYAPNGMANIASQKVLSLALPAQFTPTRQEVDAFRVKAITMIRNYGFPSTSLTEALRAVRQAPVQGTADDTEHQTTDSTIVTFTQTLQPFPGEMIVLEGSFSRNAHSKVASVPIPDSFRLYSKSSQTGFPHPIQHNGWGLCDKALPPCPDAIERVPLYRVLFEQKRKIAMSLLPHGWRLPHAKELQELKLATYETQSESLLNLHQRLAYSIAAAAGHEDSTEVSEVIKALFAHLKNESGAIDKLSQAYHCISEMFITRPSEHLHNGWIELRASDAWQMMDAQQRLECATRLYREAVSSSMQMFADGYLAQLSPEITDYIRTMGQLFADAGCELVLQYMSEKMGYEPEPLSSFALKVQTNAFKQLMTFLVDMEFNREMSEEERRTRTKDRLIQALEGDIACFEEEDPLRCGRSVASLALELQDYYGNRNRRNLAIGYD
ncbi:MAG: hypothetical protein Q8K75_06185 [Chlamydiales bacterium]|nr:hypothetical protein [Chlamydiales bacterium]